MGNIPSNLPSSSSCHTTASKRLRNREFFEPAIKAVRSTQLPIPRSIALGLPDDNAFHITAEASFGSGVSQGLAKSKSTLDSESKRDSNAEAGGADEENVHDAVDVAQSRSAAGQFKTLCCVRKRPMVEKEVRLKDYDVLSGSSCLDQITISDADSETTNAISNGSGNGNGNGNSDANGGAAATPMQVPDYSTSSLWAHRPEFKLDNKMM